MSFSILVILIIFIILYHMSMNKKSFMNTDSEEVNYPMVDHSIPIMNSSDNIDSEVMNCSNNRDFELMNYPMIDHSIPIMNDWIDKDSIKRFDYPQDNHSIPRMNCSNNINHHSIPIMNEPIINKAKDRNYFYLNNLWNIQPQEIPTMGEETTSSPFLNEETTPNYSFEDINFY